MAGKKGEELNIFKRSRLRFSQMREDVISYLKGVYKDNGETFTTASPFFQIVQVILHIGRMILYYISTSINELNITRAFHPRSVRGLATLTGHNPSRGVAARGTVRLTCRSATDYDGDTVIIPNYTVIKNYANGMKYVLNMPSERMYVIVGSSESTIDVPIVQGAVKYQQFTGSGYALDSFNVPFRGEGNIDQFFVNVYVNGERWRVVESLLDMTFDEKACIVKTGASGGIDVFFGTGAQGRVPDQGSTIKVEYLVSSADAGNIESVSVSDNDAWTFESNGWNDRGEEVSLNEIFSISAVTDVLFGATPEVIPVTRLIAPHASRSFVLANATNYEYFLRKLNMFSVIDTISGFSTYEDSTAETKYGIAMSNYLRAQNEYKSQVNLTGVNSLLAQDKLAAFKDAETELDKAEAAVRDSKLDDNIIYLFLVPDISKRMGVSENYFTCDPKCFRLTDDEKKGILDLIEESGQRIITVDNEIIDPKMPQFAINIFIQMWEGYTFENVKHEIVSAVSDYLISNTRRDRIPSSDLVAVIEGIDGVDSVSVYFDADRNNSTYYGDGAYGLDEFGDIVLTRKLTDAAGTQTEVQDLLPVFRSVNAESFTSPAGVEYYDDIDNLSSVINVTLRGRTYRKDYVKNNIS